MGITLSQLGKFFYPYLNPYKGKMLLLCLFPLIWCLVETIAPFLIKLVIDDLSKVDLENHQIQKGLGYVVSGYIALVFILEVVIRACNYVWIKTFPDIRRDIQANVLALVQGHGYTFFQNAFSGDLVSRYRSLTDGFETIFKSLLYGFYPAFLSFLFSLAFIATMSLFFACLFLLWFLAMNFVAFFFHNKSILASQDQAAKQNLLFGYVGDFLGNPLTVMSYPQDISEEKEFQRLQNESVLSTRQAEFIVFQADIWRSVLSWALLAGMILFLSWGWYHQWITLGDFSFIATVCFYVRRTIWMASVQLSDFVKEMGKFKEALSLIEIVPPAPSKALSKSEASDLLEAPEIIFSEVCFGYDKGRPIFQDFSLEIPPGQKLGISGVSGIGKTSLLHLLLRFYEPDEESIKINGQDYRNIPLQNLRTIFSYIPQTPILLHRSIFDNILFGNPLASAEEVYDAAHICLCDEFIYSLPKAYDTVVGEGGYKLSGGQRQRIAIARAYLRRALIFILDEATSALDRKNEEKLLEHLCDRLKSHTFILVSHRPSSLEKMERVISLDGSFQNERYGEKAKPT